MMDYAVFDCHCDTAYELWRHKESISETSCCVDLTQMKQFPSCAQFFAFCTYAGVDLECSSEQLLNKSYEYFMEQLRTQANDMMLCRSYEDYKLSCDQRKIGAFLSLEGAEGICCDPEQLELLRNMGFSMVSLTWNANNPLAGCSVCDGGGLTSLGKVFVQEAQRLGMVIDVSHISDKAFWDIIDITQQPVIASHSNSRAVCGHSRNLTDEQFCAICETGGCVGINLYSAFLTNSDEATFDHVLGHIEHFMELGGLGHISLGGDLDGCDSLPKGFDKYGSYNKLASYLELKGFKKEIIQDIYSNTIKEVIKLCSM